MPKYPGELEAKIVSMHGDAGREWLDRLPAVVRLCAEMWGLTVEPPFPNLTYNYAAPARRADGTAAVLKLGVPTDTELMHEAEALAAFDGRGAVRLLAFSARNAALLLERAEPGTMLAAVQYDERATRHAAAVMRSLWRSPPDGHSFPTVHQWSGGLRALREKHDSGTGPVPESLVGAAEQLFSGLLATAGPDMLLHGDLHHYNILSARRQPWLAIDPKGVIGEPAYEPAPFLLNPSGLAQRPDAEQLLRSRIRILADELELDAHRIHAWASAHSVLSLCWSVEDHGGLPADALRLAQMLHAMRV